MKKLASRMLKRRMAAVVVSATALIATGLTATPASADGGIEIRLKDGYCLDIPNGNAVAGAQIREWTCNGSMAQRWAFASVDSTHFLIYSYDNHTLCLNNWEGGDKTGNHIKLYTCANSPDGSFNWVYKGTGIQMQPRVASQNCLNAWGGSAQGAEIRLYPCLDVPNENF
ncbi:MULTISPECIES: RICIN domain-containing protein [Kitasatospora]|uniref:RICIN domain-containing protein n=1 Tax=Kitasatospora TaxID=2063 RepID=UPI0012FDC82B|nr:ricin-type beta-trefoil lectin domain protein [Kitasatospora sp. CB02891]